MAQSDLLFSWGANSGLGSKSVVNGKAYFATISGANYLNANEAAPAKEAYIYFDKDGSRYNVIAKRAIFDTLGNKIVDKYISHAESSGNTLSFFSPGQGDTAVDSATIINSVKNSWTAGKTAGPKIVTTINGKAGSGVAIPSASATASGVVVTGNQSFAGIKTFVDETDSSSVDTGAVIIKGGLGIAKQLRVGTAANIGTTLTVGTSATIGTNLTVASGANIGTNLSVGGFVKIANAVTLQYTADTESLDFIFS